MHSSAQPEPAAAASSSSVVGMTIPSSTTVNPTPAVTIPTASSSHLTLTSTNITNWRGIWNEYAKTTIAACTNVNDLPQPILGGHPFQCMSKEHLENESATNLHHYQLNLIQAVKDARNAAIRATTLYQQHLNHLRFELDSFERRLEDRGAMCSCIMDTAKELVRQESLPKPGRRRKKKKNVEIQGAMAVEPPITQLSRATSSTSTGDLPPLPTLPMVATQQKQTQSATQMEVQHQETGTSTSSGQWDCSIYDSH